MIVQLTSWFSFLQSLIWPFLALQLFLVYGTRFRQVHECHDSVMCSRNRPFAAQGHVTCLMQKLDSTLSKSEGERAWELARKRETWMKAIFSWMRNTVFCCQFSPQNTGNRFLGLWNFPKIFWGARPQTPPEEGDYGPLVDTVGSIQTCRLLQLLLKRLVTWDSLICILNTGCPPVLGSP